jgi:hypothetical protein
MICAQGEPRLWVPTLIASYQPTEIGIGQHRFDELCSGGAVHEPSEVRWRGRCSPAPRMQARTATRQFSTRAVVNNATLADSEPAGAHLLTTATAELVTGTRLMNSTPRGRPQGPHAGTPAQHEHDQARSQTTQCIRIIANLVSLSNAV